MTKDTIDPRVFDLYDKYCHGRIDRRQFFERAAALTIGGVSLLAMAESLLPRYAEAAVVSFTDERINARYVNYPSPGGTSGEMRGYLVQPAAEGPFPAVLVIHENRGLNPYIEDVARRAALEGFVALAPDGLSPIGGYPGNDDDGRAMQKSLDQAELQQDMQNSARFLKSHELSDGKLGATGFCWGGGITNWLAVTLGGELDAGVPFYGAAPDSEDVAKIRAPLLIHYAEDDARINAMRADFEDALKANDVRYQMYTYPRERDTGSTTIRRRVSMPRRRSWPGIGPWRSSSSIWDKNRLAGAPPDPSSAAQPRLHLQQRRRHRPHPVQISKARFPLWQRFSAARLSWRNR